MSKNKKLSLNSSDTHETFIYKPKELIWAKMKGFTPWPAMITAEPPIDLLNQQRKANTKCVFFFGSRNFAWIEVNNLKPFEGPWKDDLAKVAKPNSFRQAIADIENYIKDPTEVDAIIEKVCATNHSTEADFDRIRDGYQSNEENDAPIASSSTIIGDAAADGSGTSGGDVVEIITADDDGHVIDSNTINDNGNTSLDVFRQYSDINNLTPIKKTPKPKASASGGGGGGGSAKAKSLANSVKASPNRKRRSSQAATITAAAIGGAGGGTIPNSSSSNNKRKRRSSTPQSSDDYNAKKSASISAGVKNKILNTDALSHIGSASRRTNSIALLDRPVVTKPEQHTVNMNASAQTLVNRDIQPSELTFGFLGLGVMGSTIVKDLIFTGHKVIVWNRTSSKCQPFADAGAEVKDTPMDVVEAADVIFCCVSDPKASKDLVFGNCGVLQLKDLGNKAYVEMSTIDPETSQDIAEGITQANGRYLEVQIHGTRQEAEDGMLIILAGGDRTVFEECHSCFKTIAKNTFFLGADVGNACKVNLILQTIVGVSLVGLSEALALADRFSISLKDIIDIFELTSMQSPLLLAKGKEMAKGDFNPQQPLSHMQKDLRLVLSMAENLDQSMPVTAITNEVFKHTKRLGYSEHDSSAVFVRSRF